MRIAARIAKDYPDSNKGWGITIDRMVDRVVRPRLKQTLWVLLAAVGFVLLIACANLANLMLARGTARAREIAIRSALGANRARLIWQFLTESVLLSLIGAAVALPLGLGLMRSIKVWMPPFMLPAQADVQLDFRVLLFLFGVTLVTALMFGLGPALHVTRSDTTESLREGARGSAGGSRLRLRSVLISTEVAFAFILLAGAGLLLRSFQRLLNVDLGFETANVITMGLPRVMYRDTDSVRLTNYYREIEAAIQGLPGVRAAAVTSALPWCSRL